MTQRPQTICTMKVGLFGRLSLRGGMGGIIVSHRNEVYRGRQLVSVRYYVYTMFTVNTGHHEAWSPVTQTTPPPAPRPMIGQPRPLSGCDWSVTSLRSRISRMICPDMRTAGGRGQGGKCCVLIL